VFPPFVSLSPVLFLFVSWHIKYSFLILKDLFDDTVVPMEVPQQQNNVPSTSTLDYLHMAADEKDPLVSPPPLDRSNSGNKKKNVKKSESGDAGGKDNTITLSRARSSSLTLLEAAFSHIQRIFYERRERKRSRVFEDAADELSESSSDDLADTPPKKKQKTQAELVRSLICSNLFILISLNYIFLSYYIYYTLYMIGRCGDAGSERVRPGGYGAVPPHRVHHGQALQCRVRLPYRH